MTEMMPYIWLVMVVVMAVTEATTAQLVSIWFVVGAIAALITSIFVPSVVLQIFIFILVSMIALLLTRPFIKKLLSFKKEDTNVGRYVGKTGVVIESINNNIGKGQVNVCGHIWTARSVDEVPIEEGCQVVVESIEGVKLMVKSIKTEKEMSE